MKKEIPKEAQILGEPFIMLYNSSIITGEDEPNWSLNMKRAIAGILYVDIRKINKDKVHVEEVRGYCLLNALSRLVVATRDPFTYTRDHRHIVT